MKYLFDTQALLWITIGDEKLSNIAKQIFLNPNNEIFISIASIWEITIKVSLKKLNIGSSVRDFVQTHIKGNDVKILNMELDHIFELEYLPFHHRDPFDRFLISQSIVNKIPIISSDKLFDLYSVKRIW